MNTLRTVEWKDYKVWSFCIGKVMIFFSSMARQPYMGRASSFRQGFMVTLRHTTLGRTPLDEEPARRRDLYLRTHNTHKRQTSMP
jgi:hypothetical protein